MLPKSPEGTSYDENNSRYADVALGLILSQFENEGITSRGLIAKIVGGANMFPDIQGRSQKVGERNIETVKDIITSFNVRIDAEETGGHTGRAVSFDLSNGIVTVTMTI